MTGKILLLIAAVSAGFAFISGRHSNRYVILKGRELEEALKAEKERMSTNSILEDIEKGLLD